ncbi:transposable element Tc1 transposase [Trichonephila clavipes]|nr:transposable element Tc1 transposase [Trichonephila clavipes]
MINGRTRLHVVANGTMTGQRYIDEVLLPHDCLDSEGIQRLVWPARSLDLNRIENVWDVLGRQVADRNYPPTNKNTLIRALTEDRDKLPQQLLDNVVQSMIETDRLRKSGIARHIVVEAMRSLEVAGKNGWTIADFRVMMVTVDLGPQKKDNARPYTARVAMNYFTAFQTLHWSDILPDLSPVEHVQDMMGRQLHLPGNVDDLARQLEQICEEILQETIRGLYHSMPRQLGA